MVAINILTKQQTLNATRLVITTHSYKNQELFTVHIAHLYFTINWLLRLIDSVGPIDFSIESHDEQGYVRVLFLVHDALNEPPL